VTKELFKLTFFIRDSKKSNEALIPLEEKTRASVLTSEPARGELAGRQELKGYKTYFQ
jgi:hypothetical protein